jgi:hypothetical protein
MSFINTDLENLNFQFLVMVRECAKHNPMDATWKFNLNTEEIERISGMTLDELRGIAGCSRAVFTLLPINQTPSTSTISSSILAALLPEITQTSMETV